MKSKKKPKTSSKGQVGSKPDKEGDRMSAQQEEAIHKKEIQKLKELPADEFSIKFEKMLVCTSFIIDL